MGLIGLHALQKESYGRIGRAGFQTALAATVMRFLVVAEHLVGMAHLLWRTPVWGLLSIFLLALGVAGGPMQPQGHVQLLSNLVDHGMSAQDAVDHPRHLHKGDTLLVEGRVPEAEVEKLREMGHEVEVGGNYVVPTGGAQLIRVMKNSVRPAAATPAKLAAL